MHRISIDLRYATQVLFLKRNARYPQDCHDQSIITMLLGRTRCSAS